LLASHPANSPVGDYKDRIGVAVAVVSGKAINARLEGTPVRRMIQLHHLWSGEFAKLKVES
jgi:hypothetical protein